jgi:hypothetical protein
MILNEIQAARPGSAESVEPSKEERRWSALKVSIPFYPGRKSFAENLNEIELVAPTGFDSQASLFEIAFEGLALAK